MIKGKIQNWKCFNFKCAKLPIPPLMKLFTYHVNSYISINFR